MNTCFKLNNHIRYLLVALCYFSQTVAVYIIKSVRVDPIEWAFVILEFVTWQYW